MQSFIRTSNFWLRLDVLIFDDHPRLSFMTSLFFFFFFFDFIIFKNDDFTGGWGRGLPQIIDKEWHWWRDACKKWRHQAKKNTVSFPIIPVGIVLRKDHG